MPITGSEPQLSGLLFAERSQKILAQPDVVSGQPNTAKQQALADLQEVCDADSRAIVAWILAAGANSIVATTAGTGAGQAAPGAVVVGAGGSIPGPVSGATTTPQAVTTATNASVTTSSLV